MLLEETIRNMNESRLSTQDLYPFTVDTKLDSIFRNYNSISAILDMISAALKYNRSDLYFDGPDLVLGDETISQNIVGKSKTLGDLFKNLKIQINKTKTYFMVITDPKGKLNKAGGKRSQVRAMEIVKKHRRVTVGYPSVARIPKSLSSINRDFATIVSVSGNEAAIKKLIKDEEILQFEVVLI